MNCQPCKGTGFVNLEQVPDEVIEIAENSLVGFHDYMLEWIATFDDHDVAACDCCGNGDGWHGEPGEHREADFGPRGPYAYNGGLPECW